MKRMGPKGAIQVEHYFKDGLGTDDEAKKQASARGSDAIDAAPVTIETPIDFHPNDKDN